MLDCKTYQLNTKMPKTCHIFITNSDISCLSPFSQCASGINSMCLSLHSTKVLTYLVKSVIRGDLSKTTPAPQQFPI